MARSRVRVWVLRGMTGTTACAARTARGFGGIRGGGGSGGIREHVEGDYRNPPAKGKFEKVYARSKEAMTREEVRLSRELRRVALDAVVECLSCDGVEVIVAGLDDHHLHLLGRFRDRRPRARLGWAKRHATKKVKEYVRTHGGAVGFSLAPGEGIWAKKSKAEPIRDRGHQVNTFKYIVRHGKRGAAVWVIERVRREGK